MNLTIVQFTWGLRLGGQERVVVDLAKSFHAAGFKSIVATTLYGGELADELTRAGIEFFCFGLEKSYSLRGLPAVIRFLKYKGANVVITHGRSGSLLPRLAAIYLQAPVFMHVEHTLGARQPAFTRLINQLVFGCADRIVCVSSAVRDSFLSFYRFQAARTVVIHNGIDVNRFSHRIEAKNGAVKQVGIIANFEAVKGHAYFLGAAARVARLFPNVEFVLVGDGHLRAPMQKLAQKIGIAEKCRFLGRQADIEGILKQLDIFVLSSLVEGLPISLLEAQFLGVPAVAASSGGIPEVIRHGENGLLVQPRDEEALATAMLQLLTDDKLRSRLSANAQRRALADFSLAHTSHRYLDEIKKILRDKGYDVELPKFARVLYGQPVDKKVIFFTVNVPFAKGEEFVLQEILALKKLGLDFVICPRKKPAPIFHREALDLVEQTIALPPVNARILGSLLLFCLRRPLLMTRLLRHIVFQAAGFGAAMKNLAVLPKAVAVAQLYQNAAIDHAHAYWGSTPATMAYIFATINNISWSTTLHRHDIYQNNMLRQKLLSSRFARCISQKGKADLLQIAGNDLAAKIKIVHVGVATNGHNGVPVVHPVQKNGERIFQFIVPATLLPVKGHRYLIDACAILRDQNISNFQCTFYGDGPLRDSLLAEVKDKALAQFIEIKSALPHDHLLALYEKHRVDCVVLPSILTAAGEHEGIPVSLMEAMAYGVPVISTNTGSISELLGDGCGVMVPDKNSAALANAMADMMATLTNQRDDPAQRIAKIHNEFNLENTAQQMYDLLLENN